MTESDSGYLLARLESVAERQDAMCRTMEQQAHEMKTMRQELLEFSIGFRSMKWIGGLMIGLAALLTRGDTSALSKIFGGGG